ncbi:DNA double-strand break repair nuclease NurA [Candidatus Woesearchaeota archaeon]|nr:DNA double-strand break repair nuclease NurA [Candidatus Woesearchaeota archaeon]
MHDDIIKEIIDSIEEDSSEANYPKFSGEGYSAHKIDSKNFHQINKTNSAKKIAFVDGGNAEILASANFSLSLMRACYVIYENNRKLGSKKFEMLAFTKAIGKSDEIHYKTIFFGDDNSIKLDEINFSSFDRTIMLGINRAEIGSVANAIRRFAELNMAKIIADNKLAEIIVLDGNLQSTITGENKHLAELYESCKKNNVILSGLSKTTSLFTDNGNLLSVVLSNMSPLHPWYYYPIVEIGNPSHRAEMFFVKFHEKSRHVFRFEIFNQQKPKAEETINILATNCVDPIFLGYPYGLIEADRIARVSNNEKESLKMMFLIKLRNRNVEKYLSSVNAHEILDRISF